MAKEYRTDYHVSYAHTFSGGHGFGAIHIISTNSKKGQLPTTKNIDEWITLIKGKNPHFSGVVVLNFCKVGAPDGS